jgi:hypothetical protein
MVSCDNLEVTTDEEVKLVMDGLWEPKVALDIAFDMTTCCNPKR